MTQSGRQDLETDTGREREACSQRCADTSGDSNRQTKKQHDTDRIAQAKK